MSDPVIKVIIPQKQFVNALKNVEGGLSIAASNTVNKGADMVLSKYKSELNKFTIRNNYTLGSLVLYKSKPKRSNGEFRTLKGINSKVGVRKMKGGKEHYLLDQEQGKTKGGSSATAGMVALPLDRARVGGTHKGIIGGRYRIYKNLFQTIVVGGKTFGRSGDGFSKKQRFAIAQKYAEGTKMFIMETPYGLAMFGKQGGKVKEVRDLSHATVRIKPTHKFAISFNSVSTSTLESIFRQEAINIIRGVR